MPEGLPPFLNIIPAVLLVVSVAGPIWFAVYLVRSLRRIQRNLEKIADSLENKI